MKKLIFRNYPLLLSLLILILVGNLQTKNKTHTNIAGTMKQVIHQIAREKGHIPLGLGSAHELIEAIAKDPIVYRDIARENHIVINRDNWHGISPTDMPLGRELYSIYRSMADYGMIDRYELRDIFEAMQYTPINEWELWMLPEKVQRKIIAIYQIAKSSDPKKLVSALVKNSHLTLVFESHSTPEILEFKTPHNQKIKSKNEFEEISEQIQNSTKKMGQDLHSWARIYGGSNSDTASSIQQTIDGGYIVAGRTGSFGAGYIDSWILKLDSVGDIEWQHTYGGIDSDRASSIQQTTDGGYIVAGYTHSFGAGDNDYWILKLTSNGDIEWQRTYGGTDGDKAYSIQQTSDGGYIVAGYTHSFGAGDYDYLILKLSSIGDIEWQRSYGGNDHEEASSIQQTSDGGYIVAGYTWSYIAGYLDIWILKLTSSGNIEWQRTYGGTNGDKAYSIQQTSDGGYIVTGIFGYSGFMEILSCDFWVLKLSSSGDIEWQRTYGGSSTPGHVRENCAYSIQQTSDGGYIVAGSTWSFGAGWHDFLILKLTSSGDIEWQRTYGGTDGDKAYSIQQTLDGGYIVAGYSESFYVPRRPYKIDILVLKLSSSGEILYFPEIVVGITTVTVSDTSITPQDTYIVPQEINITPQDTNIIPQNSNARESWLFSLPLNFTGKMELNRSLSQAEYINVLTWEANPNNEDLNIVKYRIYQVEGESQSLLVELNAGTFKYWHRNVEKDKEYAYVIVAVNDDGGEGVPAYVKVQ